MNLPVRALLRLLPCLLAVTVALPAPCHAFSETTHRFLTARVLANRITTGNMSGLPQESIVEFWTWFGQTMMQDERKPDDLDGWRFAQRFPTQQSFSATSVRAFLGFNYTIDRRIRGLDSIDDLDGTDRVNAHVQASAWPDLDGRNQDRVLMLPTGQPAKLPDGRLVPFDPMTLNMGEVTGLSSQAHAHYQLVADKPNDAVETLQKEPWNFVVAVGWPGPVETYAAQMAQLHLDLAALASYWGHVRGTSASEPIMVAWQGAGFHYVEDAAGPLHTVQVGSYALFKRAKIAYWLEAAKTCGGYCGTLPSFTKIGLNYLHNHHLMAEAWLEDQIDRAMAGKNPHPEIAKAWAELDKDDPELIAALGDKLKPYQDKPLKPAPWQDKRGLATILVETEAKLASRDGAALYEAALLAGAPTLTALETTLPDDGGWRESYLGDPKDPQVKAAVDTMAKIQAKSLRRAATALRIYYDALETASVEAAFRRTRRACLDQCDAADKRRDAYMKNPPPSSVQIVRDPQFLAAEVGAFLLFLAVLWLVLRRLSRTAAA